MSENVRDAQFAGFAEKLLGELLSKRDGMLDVSDWWKEQARLAIAQRAYDLVEHAIGCVEMDPGGATTTQLVGGIPDLTEWPEEEAAALEHYANHQYDGVDFGEEIETE